MPNPPPTGRFTCGPENSLQRRCTDPASRCHATSTPPDEHDNAPCFAALVASSCTASASACAVGAGERRNAPFHRGDVLIHAVGARQADDRMNHGERVLGAMIDFAGEQRL